jgi:1-acyl-sn-glycerol-3-phosphate acyltransferase
MAPVTRPSPADPVPRRGNVLTRTLGRLVLRLMRFRIVGELPPVRRCVMIAAPHTSNWDFVLGVAAMLALRLRVSWLGKHTIFRFPVAGLLRFWGGLPIDRGSAEGVVEAVAQRLRTADQLYLALSPEGTRRKVERWKSGFYRIARAADVPIFMVAFDYQRRQVELGPLFEPTGDFEGDLARLRARFSAEMAYRPENF